MKAVPWTSLSSETLDHMCPILCHSLLNELSAALFCLCHSLGQLAFPRNSLSPGKETFKVEVLVAVIGKVHNFVITKFKWNWCITWKLLEAVTGQVHILFITKFKQKGGITCKVLVYYSMGLIGDDVDDQLQSNSHYLSTSESHWGIWCLCQ
jgi:hypothetical protein